MKKRNKIFKNFIVIMIMFCVIAIIKQGVFKSIGAEDEIDYSKYYYMQLSDEAKLIYDGLISSITKTKTGTQTIEISINAEVFNSLKNNGNEIVQSAMDAFDRDHPEVFWLDVTKLQVKFKSNKIMLTPVKDSGNYLITDYENMQEPSLLSRDQELMEESINNIITNTEKMTDYEKVKYIHDYLVINNEYNQDPMIASAKAYKSISALVGNIDNEFSPLCEGYARAFKVLCDRTSIPCVIVSGESSASNEHSGHMWNYVMIDEKWYAIDVTWDDPVLLSGSYNDLSEEKKYEYFLIGEEKVLKTHIPESIFTGTQGYDFAFDYPMLHPLNYGDKTPLYSINITKYSNGVISTNLKNNEYVKPGTRVKISVEIKEGMKLINGSLKVNGKAIEDMEFSMPGENVVITAAFITESYVEPDDSGDNNEQNDENQEDEESNENNGEEDEGKDENTETTKEPENEDTKNDNDNELENTKSPIKTKEPHKEDDNTVENNPATKKPPKDTDKEESKVTNKPTTSKSPQTIDKVEKPGNKDDEQSQVIIIEDNFEAVNPFKNIKIINKAAISMSNKEVRFNFTPELREKDITFYIANMGQPQDNILDIISKDYLIKDGSILDTLHIIVYDNDMSGLSNMISKDTPLTVFIPVDSSWISKDYEKYFYLIENKVATKKIVMVRESMGQYYLQIKLESPQTSYAILRKRTDEYVIPGTTSNGIISITNDDSEKNSSSIQGTKELILISLVIIATVLTFKVIAIQHKASKIENEK